MEQPVARPRPRALAAVAAAVVLAGCGPSATETGRCPTPPAADVRTGPGWLGYLAAHPGDVAFVVDDGRGHRTEHRADAVQPLASASKAVTMVAYAREVALGRARQDEPVRLGDWERWSVQDSAQSHIEALDYLRIPRRGEHVLDPDRTVTLDQLANVMIIFSDNAAPDYLHDRLGDRAVADAARTVGADGIEQASSAGVTLSYLYPERVPLAWPRARRRAAEWDLARRYAYDPAFRAEADLRPGMPSPQQYPWAAGAPGGTARQLQALWSAVARGGFPGAGRARAIGEQRPNPFPGARARGTKGGSLAGIVTTGYELRRDDGTVASMSVLVQHMSPQDTAKLAESNAGFTALPVAALQDPAALNLLRCLG